MPRLMLNDELWSKLREIILQHRIYDKSNLRMIVEAMLYRMRVGCPWRDLPVDFGCKEFNLSTIQSLVIKKQVDANF